MKQERTKCKHIECCMDGCYCKIKKGADFNHCVLPFYAEKCEYFEEKEIKLQVSKRDIIGYFRICSLCGSITEMYGDLSGFGGVHFCEECKQAVERVKKAIKEGKL